MVRSFLQVHKLLTKLREILENDKIDFWFYCLVTIFIRSAFKFVIYIEWLTISLSCFKLVRSRTWRHNSGQNQNDKILGYLIPLMKKSVQDSKYGQKRQKYQLKLEIIKCKCHSDNAMSSFWSKGTYFINRLYIFKWRVCKLSQWHNDRLKPLNFEGTFFQSFRWFFGYVV